jgi:hypothetical protein
MNVQPPIPSLCRLSLAIIAGKLSKWGMHCKKRSVIMCPTECWRLPCLALLVRRKDNGPLKMGAVKATLRLNLHRKRGREEEGWGSGICALYKHGC